MYVRSQFSFQFFPAVIQLTAIASLYRADVLRVRLGVTVGNSVSNHVQTAPTSALGEVNAPFETQVSAIVHTTYLNSRVTSESRRVSHRMTGPVQHVLTRNSNLPPLTMEQGPLRAS